MDNLYYTLPLRFDLLLQKKRHQGCQLKTSIAQNLHLLISSYRGESAFTEDFGCSLWEEEFNITADLRWKENFLEFLETAVSQFEKRLLFREAGASLREQTETISKAHMRVRRCLHIEITGVIKKTNEDFVFRDQIFISPLAQK